MEEANDMQLKPSEQKTLEKIVVYLENSIVEIKNLLPKDSNSLYKGIEEALSDVAKYMTKEKERLGYAIKHYDVSIDELNLPKRAYNCLVKKGLKNIGEIVQYSADELLGKNGFGKKSLWDLKRALSKYNLDLKDSTYRISK
jgi:DNA-directed RNA polymerase alpha subunit